MNDQYQARQGQVDCDVKISRIGWRSKLSRITPRVAEIMLQNGTNLFTRKIVTNVNLRPGQPADNPMGNQSKTGTDTGNGDVEHSAPAQQPEPKARKAKRKAKHT
jgi:hypothetical protein